MLMNVIRLMCGPFSDSKIRRATLASAPSSLRPPLPILQFYKEGKSRPRDHTANSSPDTCGRREPPRPPPPSPFCSDRSNARRHLRLLPGLRSKWPALTRTSCQSREILAGVLLSNQRAPISERQSSRRRRQRHKDGRRCACGKHRLSVLRPRLASLPSSEMRAGDKSSRWRQSLHTSTSRAT